MQRLIHSLLIIGLLGGWFTTLSPQQLAYAHSSDLYVPNEVIVKLFSATNLAAVTSAYGLVATPLDQFGTRPIYRLRIRDGETPFNKADRLADDVRVQYAEPNFLEETPEGRRHYSWASGGSAGGVAAQWASTSLRLRQAHAITRGAGVVVALLDTGVSLSHPLLRGRLVRGYDFVDMDTNPSERGQFQINGGYGHGTHGAGLIAMVAPQAKIMPIRVLDPNGRGNTWVLAEALAYAVNPDGNPLTDDGADVINMSLSTHRPTELLNEIVSAVTCNDDDDEEGENDNPCLGGARGVVVVAAAGNHGGVLPEYPAAEGVAGLLAVTAITRTNTLPTFANRGSWIQVAAPGVDIMSSVPITGYGVWSGTSMASALTAGVAALVRAAQPTWTASDVTNQVINTAALINTAVPRRVDAAAAVGVVSNSSLDEGSFDQPQESEIALLAEELLNADEGVAEQTIAGEETSVEIIYAEDEVVARIYLPIITTKTGD